MDISAGSAFLHHAPLLVSLTFLAIVIYPFGSLPFFARRPTAPTVWFLIPLLLGAALAFYGVQQTYRGAADSGNVSFNSMAWGFAEAVICLTFGAGSSFLTALFKVRSRRREVLVVLAVTGLVLVVTWAVGSRLLHVVRFGGSFWP